MTQYKTQPVGLKREVIWQKQWLLAQVRGIHGPLKSLSAQLLAQHYWWKAFAGDSKWKAKCVALLSFKGCCLFVLLCVFMYLERGITLQGSSVQYKCLKKGIQGNCKHKIKLVIRQHWNYNFGSYAFSAKACFITDSTKTETRAEKEQQFHNLKINPPWTAAHVCVRKHFSLSSRASGYTSTLSSFVTLHIDCKIKLLVTEPETKETKQIKNHFQSIVIDVTDCLLKKGFKALTWPI